MITVTCLGCGTHTARHPSGRCTPCRRTTDRVRQARRGDRYGTAHRRARSAWAPTVAAGLASCARCDGPIAPDQPWHLDHLPTGDSRPAHQTCNSRHTTRTKHGA